MLLARSTGISSNSHPPSQLVLYLRSIPLSQTRIPCQFWSALEHFAQSSVYCPAACGVLIRLRVNRHRHHRRRFAIPPSKRSNGEDWRSQFCSQVPFSIILDFVLKQISNFECQKSDIVCIPGDSMAGEVERGQIVQEMVTTIGFFPRSPAIFLVIGRQTDRVNENTLYRLWGTLWNWHLQPLRKLPFYNAH